MESYTEDAILRFLGRQVDAGQIKSRGELTSKAYALLSRFFIP